MVFSFAKHKQKMTKIQYPKKEDKDPAGTKVRVPTCQYQFDEASNSCRSGSASKKELRLLLLKTLLTIAAAALLGSAVIVFCYRYYQVT